MALELTTSFLKDSVEVLRHYKRLGERAMDWFSRKIVGHVWALESNANAITSALGILAEAFNVSIMAAFGVAAITALAKIPAAIGSIEEAFTHAKVWELGNSLGYITQRHLPATPNFSPGNANNEPGRLLLDCFQGRTQ